MKKTIVLAIAVMIGAAGFSQDSSTMRPMGGDTMGGMMHHKMMKGKMKDCIMMHDGTAMVMKGGQMMTLDQEMTLTNGTVVMTDGTVKMKDGKTKTMKNGDCIYMDGTMGRMPMKGGGKMKKDSTMM